MTAVQQINCDCWLASCSLHKTIKNEPIHIGTWKTVQIILRKSTWTCLVVYYEDSWSTSIFCNICFGSETAIASVHQDGLTSELSHIRNLNVEFAIQMTIVLRFPTKYALNKRNKCEPTLFLGLLQQSGGSAKASLVWLARFSFDSNVGPNRAPTPTNSVTSIPSTQIGIFTYLRKHYFRR